MVLKGGRVERDSMLYEQASLLKMVFTQFTGSKIIVEGTAMDTVATVLS